MLNTTSLDYTSAVADDHFMASFSHDCSSHVRNWLHGNYSTNGNYHHGKIFTIETIPLIFEMEESHNELLFQIKSWVWNAVLHWIYILLGYHIQFFYNF